MRNAGPGPLQIVVWEMAGCCLFCLACLPIRGGLSAYAGLLANIAHPVILRRMA